MTTTVKVHVNGKYRATVQQDDKKPVQINGGEERSFSLSHPAESTFRVTEEAVEDEDAEDAEDADTDADEGGDD